MRQCMLETKMTILKWVVSQWMPAEIWTLHKALQRIIDNRKLQLLISSNNHWVLQVRGRMPKWYCIKMVSSFRWLTIRLFQLSPINSQTSNLNSFNPLLITMHPRPSNSLQEDFPLSRISKHPSSHRAVKEKCTNRLQAVPMQTSGMEQPHLPSFASSSFTHHRRRVRFKSRGRVRPLFFRYPSFS